MDVTVLDDKYEDLIIFERCESVIWNDNMQKAGDFSIYTPLIDGMYNFIKEDVCLRISESPTVMYIEDWDIELTESKGTYIRITGRSLDAWLDRRVLPTTYEFKGLVKDTIYKLMDEHVVNPKDTNRKMPGVSMVKPTDPFFNDKKLDFQATGDNLYELIVSLSVEFDFGFKMEVVDNGPTVDKTLRFVIYAGLDRSHRQDVNEPVIFSKQFDNLISGMFTRTTKNLKTMAYIQGEGEYPNRKNASVVKPEKGIQRRELYVDARDLSSKLEDQTEMKPEEYIKLLEARGSLKLTETVVEEDFEGDVEPINNFVFNVDYFVGDIVQIDSGIGFNVAARVTGCIVSGNQEGLQVVPTFSIIDEEVK